jgi:hypothetical protein
VGAETATKKETAMSTLGKLHQRAAEHHEHAARHHREAAKLHEAKDVLAAVEQAHLAKDHEVNAIHYATEAAKQHLAAHRGS